MSSIPIALLAAGEMGTLIGTRLQACGAQVRTSLEGRSAKTAERVRKAGFGVAATDDELIEGAAFVLSIVPPADAEAVAERLSGPLRRAAVKPVFVECNALSPDCVNRIADVIAPTGAGFVDAAIMGSRGAGDAGPAFYACGPQAARFEELAAYGLRVRRLDGPVGRSSAMKMVYAGITKGFTAMASAVILGAERYGLAGELGVQLAETHPTLYEWIGGYIPPMYPKSARFVAEMEEIAEFLSDDPGASAIFSGAAQMYAELADAFSTHGREDGDIGALIAFARASGERKANGRSGPT